MPQFPDASGYNLPDEEIQAMAEPAPVTLATCTRCQRTFYTYVGLPPICSGCWTPADTTAHRASTGEAQSSAAIPESVPPAENALEAEYRHRMIDAGVWQATTWDGEALEF